MNALSKTSQIIYGIQSEECLLSMGMSQLCWRTDLAALMVSCLFLILSLNYCMMPTQRVVEYTLKLFFKFHSKS